MITDGMGYYQKKGKAMQIVQMEDFVKCLPRVVQWHGSWTEVGVSYLVISRMSSTT